MVSEENGQQEVPPETLAIWIFFSLLESPLLAVFGTLDQTHNRRPLALCTIDGLEMDVEEAQYPHLMQLWWRISETRHSAFSDN